MLPAHAFFGIFQNNAILRELIADGIRAREVPGLARLRMFRH